MQSVMDARAFLQRMFEMTEWAAQQDLMVSEFRADWASFGSWAIKVEKGHRALRAVWDGKEQLLTVDTAPAANAGTGWNREVERNCIDNEDELRVAQKHILGWKGQASS